MRRENAGYAGEAARLIVVLDHNHVCLDDQGSARLKYGEGPSGITYDHANDRVVDGVRNGESVNIDTIRGQRVANFRERSGFVGQKYCQLLDDSHRHGASAKR